MFPDQDCRVGFLRDWLVAEIANTWSGCREPPNEAPGSKLLSSNGGRYWREVATIFTDITGFTSLVQAAAPEVLGALLNEYVGGMTDVVFAHEGTVAKIIGDAIQILFNAPGDQPDYAARAVACAHDLDSWAEAFRGRWKSKGVNFGATRIGVHAGPALVGNFGGGRFFDYRLWRHHQHRRKA
jgi:class 3 adenylate cyclase